MVPLLSCALSATVIVVTLSASLARKMKKTFKVASSPLLRVERGSRKAVPETTLQSRRRLPLQVPPGPVRFLWLATGTANCQDEGVLACFFNGSHLW